jgi:uncharacterized protein YacL
VVPDEAREVPDVDAKLVRICLDRGAALVTLDTTWPRLLRWPGCGC